MNPLTFATQEWLDHFRGRLVDSAEFGAVTSHWEDDAKYVIEAEPEIGFPESIAYYMKWQGGKLVQAESRPAVTTGEAKFNVSAKYTAWEEVYRTRMEPGVALLTGKFTFEGPFLAAATNVAGEAMMLRMAFDVPTRFLAVAIAAE